jgi:hypothetical protein
VLFDIIDASDETHKERVVVVAINPILDNEIHDSIPEVWVRGVGCRSSDGFPVDVL